MMTLALACIGWFVVGAVVGWFVSGLMLAAKEQPPSSIPYDTLGDYELAHSELNCDLDAPARKHTSSLCERIQVLRARKQARIFDLEHHLNPCCGKHGK